MGPSDMSTFGTLRFSQFELATVLSFFFFFFFFNAYLLFFQKHFHDLSIFLGAFLYQRFNMTSTLNTLDSGIEQAVSLFLPPNAA